MFRGPPVVVVVGRHRQRPAIACRNCSCIPLYFDQPTRRSRARQPAGADHWLTIQVGNYSGKPTPAQMPWIATYSSDVDRYARQLEDLKQTLKLE
jgi:hypothetical protein